MARPVLILFARAPRLGCVKRRLAAGIGDVAALRFYRNQLASCLRQFSFIRGIEKIIAGTPDRAFLRHSPGWRAMGQGTGDLGVRMHRAFRLFPGRPVLLVGVDIPGLGPADIRSALHALRGADAMFGPAEDGGYYLVGMAARRPQKPFAAVRWSSPHALSDTLRNFSGLRVGYGRVLRDVDTAEDLAALIKPSNAL
jgi:rSAM/selenodomain-associated transferase 1